MKRVLVTGGSGFIGRHTGPHLEALGFEVQAVSSRDVNLLNPLETRVFVERIRPTHLLHLAWYVPPGKYWTSLENVRWLQASMDLLVEFAAAGGRRVLTAGTCAEYSWHSWDSDGVLSESETLLQPASLYGASKDALRRMQESLAQQLGLSSAWGRIFFPYGPGEPAGRLVPSVIDSVLRGQPARCSHGQQLRDFMYVEDVARALAMVLDSDYKGAINIGTGAPVRIADVAREAARAAGRPDLLELGALPPRRGEPDILLADVTRLWGLGFVPSWGLAAGMDATARQAKDHIARAD